MDGAVVFLYFHDVFQIRRVANSSEQQESRQHEKQFRDRAGSAHGIFSSVIVDCVFDFDLNLLIH
jgi:hypothetical protein